MTWGIPILGDLIGLGKTWIEGKNKRSQAKADAEAAVMVNASTSRAEWEKYQAQASVGSWKDEYWTLVLSVPAILCFVPPMTPYVMDGFAVLSKMPDYFKAFLAMSISASFGIKGLKQFRAGR
jgi:hypothetical protein